MDPELGWTLLTLFCASVLLWKLGGEVRRRMRFVWLLSLVAFLLWLAGGWQSSPRWIVEANIALEEVIGLHVAVVILFYIVLGRLRLPRILIELAIGAGYIVILLGLLTRVGVNLTGIIATSAVATAVIGFGLQDLLANLAGGLVLEMEQSISEGDWIRTEHYFGQVRSVRMRHIALETPDGDTVLVPNSAITRTPVTVLGRLHDSAGMPVNHRKLLTFQLPYSHSPATVIDAIDQALAASPIEGIARDPRPRCVIVDFHPHYVQYGALVWILRPALEYLDASRVRTRISFALARIGAPLVSIPQVVDLHSGSPAPQQADDRLAALRGVQILHCLNEEEAQLLASRIKKMSFAAGETILRQGDDGDSLYILQRGRVQILLAHDSGLSEQVACLAPGDFFGEMSLLTGEKRTATALALEEADCYCLAKADLRELLAERPELAGDIATVLSQRQTGLAAVRDKLGEESEKQREMQNRKDLLSRIRRYFGIH